LSFDSSVVGSKVCKLVVGYKGGGTASYFGVSDSSEESSSIL